MKKLALLLTLICGTAAFAHAQIDTIYTAGKTIPCTVVEVGSDAIKFTYPNEVAQNTLYINSVQKIVFRSGRVQEFAQASSFRTLTSPSDWGLVTQCSIESEIRGLYKLGDVSSKATGTTELANMERVKQRALRKAKMSAAMLGANVFYLANMRDQGAMVSSSIWGSSSSSPQVSITGIAYTNHPVSLDAVRHWFAQHSGSLQATTLYTLANTDSEMRETASRAAVQYEGVELAGTTVMVDATIRGERNKRFSVSFVSDNAIYLYCTDKSGVYVYKITQ